MKKLIIVCLILFFGLYTPVTAEITVEDGTIKSGHDDIGPFKIVNFEKDLETGEVTLNFSWFPDNLKYNNDLKIFIDGVQYYANYGTGLNLFGAFVFYEINGNEADGDILPDLILSAESVSVEISLNVGTLDWDVRDEVLDEWKTVLNAKETITNNYYLPVFKCQPNYWTGLGISNLSEKGRAGVKVKVYDTSGKVQTNESKIIAANGQDSFLVGADLTSDGWIKISSTQLISGLCFLGDYGANSGDYFLADVPLTDVLSKKLLIPHVAQNDTWDTTIYIANPNSAAATVTYTYTSKAGADSALVIADIPANGSAEIPVSIIADSDDVKGGRVAISSTQSMTAFALYNNVKTGNHSYAGISAIDIED